jgi:hypothetical protein
MKTNPQIAETEAGSGSVKKVENHAAAVALWFMYYNVCRVRSVES